MVVEFFFMTTSQPLRCYLALSVVLVIIILLSPFNTFTSNDGKVKLLHCLIVQSGVAGLIKGFTQIVLAKYVTNTHVFKQGILRLLLFLYRIYAYIFLSSPTLQSKSVTVTVSVRHDATEVI